MIIPFNELRHHTFAISDVDVFLQKPLYKHLVVNGRLCNGFICIKNGSCRYTSKNTSFTLSDGAVAYVPLNSKHKLEILSNSIEFYRVDFTVTVNGDMVFFSDTPIKLTDNASHECVSALRYLESNIPTYHNTVEKTEKMCTIFRTMQQSQNNAAANRIRPALEYICADPTRSVDCKQLAKLCFLGSSRFYELFRQETKKTPIEYRDSLLIRRAIMLLENTDSSINEISSELGFKNMSYFSRFFKKHTGFPPIKYRSF